MFAPHGHDDAKRHLYTIYRSLKPGDSFVYCRLDSWLDPLCSWNKITSSHFSTPPPWPLCPPGPPQLEHSIFSMGRWVCTIQLQDGIRLFHPIWPQAGNVKKNRTKVKINRTARKCNINMDVNTYIYIHMYICIYVNYKDTYVNTCIYTYIYMCVFVLLTSLTSGSTEPAI